MVAFIRGLQQGSDFALSREERLNAEARRQAEERQTQIDRGRRNAAMDELTDRYGAVAGAPTEFGQLEGTTQRRTLFDRGIEDEDAEERRAAAMRAAAMASQLRDRGADEAEIAARLDQMPDTVFGNNADEAAAGRALVMQNLDDPEGLAAALSGEVAQDQYGEADMYEVDGQQVYGRPVMNSRGEMTGFEELDFQPIQPQRVDETVARDPSGIYQRDAQTGQLYLVGRAPQPRGGAEGGAAGAGGADVFAADAAQGQAVRQYNDMIGHIDRAIEQTSVLSSGGVATFGDNMLGLNQYAENLEGALEPILANEAFSQIEAMKEAAAESGSRGTGLGQITEREITLLQNIREGLLQSQSPEILRENLGRLQEQLRVAMAAATDEYNWFVRGIPPEGYSVDAEGNLQRGGQAPQGGGQAPQGGGLDPEIEALLQQYPED